MNNNLIYNSVNILLIFTLLVDIILTCRKVYLNGKLYDLIKKGEKSYIQTVKEFAEINGYDK